MTDQVNDSRIPADRLTIATRIAQGIWVAGLAFVLTMNFSLFPFAHPRADDFDRARKSRDMGVAGSMRDEWNNWSGRWSSTGAAYALSSVIDLKRHYGILLATINLVYLFALYRLIRSVFDQRLGHATAAAWACLLWCLYWSGAPSIGETCYWLPGALENHLSLACAMLLIAQLLRYRPQGWRGWAIAGSVAVAGFVVAGMHELYALVLGLVLLACTAVAWRMRAESRWAWGALLVAVALGFAFFAAAPGNSFRSSHFPQRGQVGLTLELVARQLVQYLPGWLFDPKLLAATALLACYPKLGRLCPSWMRPGGGPWFWLVAPVWATAICGVFAGVAWSTGGWAAGRTVNVAYMLFLVGWFLLTTIAAVRLRGHRAASQAVMPLAWIGLLASLGAALALIGRPLEALTDVLDTAPKFDRELQSRYAEIERQRKAGRRRVTISKLQNRPNTFYTENDITPDPSDWRNELHARYWQVESVATLPDGPESRSPEAPDR